MAVTNQASHGKRRSALGIDGMSGLGHLLLTCSQFANFMNSEAIVHVISRRRLLEAGQKHGDLFGPLDHWFRTAKRASWRSIEDVRQVFPAADGVGRHTVFNIKGNKYRLIVEINYLANRLYIRHVLTHAEYDKGAWKL